MEKIVDKVIEDLHLDDDPKTLEVPEIMDWAKKSVGNPWKYGADEEPEKYATGGRIVPGPSRDLEPVEIEPEIHIVDLPGIYMDDIVEANFHWSAYLSTSEVYNNFANWDWGSYDSFRSYLKRNYPMHTENIDGRLAVRAFVTPAIVSDYLNR